MRSLTQERGKIRVWLDESFNLRNFTFSTSQMIRARFKYLIPLTYLKIKLISAINFY